MPLAPVAMTMNGSPFHPKVLMSFRSGWYFWVLFSVVYGGNLSLQNVNSIK